MLGAAVIPKGDGIAFPAESALKIHAAGNVVVEHLQNILALMTAQFHNPCGESRVNVQAFPLGHRMGSDDRVDGFGIIAIPQVFLAAVAAAMHMFRSMLGTQTIQKFLHSVRQCLVRSVHVGEQCVAAMLWHGMKMEYAAHWRLHITAYVGMPGSAGHEFGILV